jgi:Tfp pilus assembly protein PilZ
MNDLMTNLIERAPRYRLSRDGNMTIVIEYEGEESLQTVSAVLLDISTGGAKLQTDVAIPMRDIVMLQLQVPELKRTMTVSGEVCWVSPTNESKWHLGCSFRPPMPEETLDEFAQHNILERRRHERHQVALRTTARFELSQDESPVWILNISEGGFCILTQRDGVPGERVQLILEPEGCSPIHIRAKAQWQVETDEGIVVGCEFRNASDYEVLRDLDNSTTPRKKRRSLWSWLGFISNKRGN